MKASLVRVRMYWTVDQPDFQYRCRVHQTVHILTNRGVIWAVNEAQRVYGHRQDFRIRGVVVECDGADTDVILDPEVSK